MKEKLIQALRITIAFLFPSDKPKKSNLKVFIWFKCEVVNSFFLTFNDGITHEVIYTEILFFYKESNVRELLFIGNSYLATFHDRVNPAKRITAKEALDVSIFEGIITARFQESTWRPKKATIVYYLVEKEKRILKLSTSWYFRKKMERDGWIIDKNIVT